MEKEEVVLRNEKFTWYLLCMMAIGVLVAGLVLNDFRILIFLPFILYGCILEYKHLNRRIILNKDGLTTDSGVFYAWKSIDHCYLEQGYNRRLIIVFKDKDEPRDSVLLNNFSFKDRELEDAIDRLAGKSLIRYTYEDKEVEKKDEKESNKTVLRGFLKFFLILIGFLLLIALFSFYYARIEH